ncbi:molybdate ABC transporter substrate-binding protein [Hydrogenophaga sp. Root209]|uniref:molybdate ABC transporter substrate-binding protein n=1 Tax=Hydrogenophaga sp. Root209 TaxID=1736490 RepID=UPI0009E709A7|nr:molybdate ABC transporter substrate-binding protein [Hydrogenophaga sp. Root209]
MRRSSLMTVVALVALAGCASPEATPLMKEPLQVYAAGSLREALTEIARDHEARTGQKIALTFGASGLLRERIEKGEGAQVFASADTQHPQRLAAAGGWVPHTVFVRNSLCALTQASVNTTPQNLLETMLDPAVKLGTSTPKADPSGDYAWELFRKAETVRTGAYAALEAKALKLTGGPDSPKPPAGQGTYAWVMDQGQADVFLTYCTNAVASQKEVPRLKVVQVPAALQVGASYGLTVRRGAPASAEAFAKALLAPPAQVTFARYGFGQP